MCASDLLAYFRMKALNSGQVSILKIALSTNIKQLFLRGMMSVTLIVSYIRVLMNNIQYTQTPTKTLVESIPFTFKLIASVKNKPSYPLFMD